MSRPILPNIRPILPYTRLILPYTRPIHCTTYEGTHPPPLDAGCPFPPQGPQPAAPKRVTRQTRHPPSLSPRPPPKGAEVAVEAGTVAGR